MPKATSSDPTSHRQKTSQHADPEGDHTPLHFSWIAKLQVCLALLVPILGISLCGSGEPWAYGLLAVAMGLCFLLAPPRGGLPAKLTIPLILVILLPLGAFLPMSWFSQPGWREHLPQEYGIALGDRVSPQPWVTLEAWFVFTLSLLWLAYCLMRKFNEHERRWLLRGVSLFLATISVIAIWHQRQNLPMPSLWREEGTFMYYFGPFPNRNSFAGLSAIGSIITIAVAYDTIRRHHKSWILYALAILPQVSALILNTSRSGIVIFLVGVGGWMLTAAYRKASLRRLVIVLSVMMVLSSMFLIFGKRIIHRFSSDDGVVATLSSDGRFAIWGQTLEILKQTPVFGIGLGNFEPYFALTRSPGSPIYRNRHPESDWLWFATETGIPALLFGALGAYFFVQMTGALKLTDRPGRKDRRLRNAAGIGALLIMLQGIFDRPMHYTGLIALAAILAGTALRHRKSATTAPPSPLLLRGFGLLIAMAAFACGALWLGISQAQIAWKGDFDATRNYRESTALAARGDNMAALEKINRAIESRPLQWNYYYTRANLMLRAGYPSPVVLAEFTRARTLEPHLASFCMTEATTWVNYDPLYAISAWKEAIQRFPASYQSYYASALAASRLHPELRRSVKALGGDDAKLKLMYLLDTTGPAFNEILSELLEEFPNLDPYTSAERLQLFTAWNQQGDKAKLSAMLKEKPAWRRDGWSVLASEHASNGQFKEACQLAVEYLEPPFMIPPKGERELPQLRRQFVLNGLDISQGLELYETEKNLGLVDEALLTLDQLAQLPDAPAKILYEQAVMLTRKNEYTRAWDKFLGYQTKQKALQR